MRRKQQILLLGWLLTGCFLLASCRNSHRSADLDTVQIGLVAPVFPPIVGPGVVKFQVTDAAGQPVSDLNLDIKGDMTHAGMVPELATISAGEDGIYAAPFEWTMAGDWIITVNATGEDGAITQRRFNLSVDGDVPICAPDSPVPLNEEE